MRMTMDYQKIITKIKKSLAHHGKVEVKAQDIENLSAREINSIMDEIKQYNLACIDNYQNKGMIDEESADYMRSIFGNPMEAYRVMYKNICHTLMNTYRPGKMKILQEMGEAIGPEEINAIDLETGMVEKNEQMAGYHNHNNMGMYKEYQAKHITPFTSMRLTFYDYRDNPIYVIMPGMKNIHRAIDKIKLPVYDSDGKQISQGGKYYQQFVKDVEKIKKKKLSEEEQQQEISKLPKPYQRLKDMMRLTITRKYYADTVETMDLLKNSPQYHVNPKECKDSFNANSNDNKAYGLKNYREKRIYINMDLNGNPFTVETQIKINKLNEGDYDTHLIYAGVENEESRDADLLLVSSENTSQRGLRYWEENEKKYLTEGDRKIAKMNTFKYQMAIQQKYKEKIRAYNLQVMDKAFRLEDAKQANGIDYDGEAINPISHEKHPIYNIAAKFINENFIYRPFKAFDLSMGFNTNNAELKSLGLVINENQVEDLTERYLQFILPRYNGYIYGNEDVRFSGEDINDLNAPEEYQNIPDQDELEMMEDFDKKTLFVEKEERTRRILKKKQTYYQNKQKKNHNKVIKNILMAKKQTVK